MFHIFVDHLLIAIQTEVVTVLGDLALGHAEAVCCARAFALCALAIVPAGERIGQVVLCGFVWGEWIGGDGAELLRGEERLAFVVEGPAVGLHVVEPDLVGAAGVGAGEEEDGRGDAGVGAEDA